MLSHIGENLRFGTDFYSPIWENSPVWERISEVDRAPLLVFVSSKDVCESTSLYNLNKLIVVYYTDESMLFYTMCSFPCKLQHTHTPTPCTHLTHTYYAQIHACTSNRSHTPTYSFIQTYALAYVYCIIQSQTPH